MNFSKVLDLLKISFKSKLAIFLVLLLFAIMPAELRTKLGIETFYLKYTVYFSIGLIISGVFVLIESSEPIYLLIKRKIAVGNVKKMIRRKLENMTDLEKQICHEAMNNNGMITLDYSSGVSISLEHQYVLVRASTVSLALLNFPYRLNDYAIEYLKKKPELLNSPIE